MRTAMGSLEWRLLPLGAILCLLLGPRSAGPASLHTLHYFKTAFWELGWELPQFVSLMYMDDQLTGRYDRATDQCMPQSSWIEEISREDADFWARNTGRHFASSLIADLMFLKDLFNQSRGIRTLQVFSGCKWSRADHTPRGFVRYGYNGRDFLSLDLQTRTWTVLDAEAKPIKRKWDAEQDRGEIWEHFLTSTCTELLHTLVLYGEEDLLKINPPKGCVPQKAGSEGLKTLICRLHGFYPKEIDMTWQKGGEVWHQDVYTGGVVPNSDGTYHTWLSIEVDPKERDLYRCHVEHDGLKKPLDMAWEEPASNLRLILPIVGALVGALMFVGAGVVALYMSRRKWEEKDCKAAPEKQQIASVYIEASRDSTQRFDSTPSGESSGSENTKPLV